MTQSDLIKDARNQRMNPKEYRALSKPHKHRAKAGYYCLDCFLPYQKPVDKKLKCACGGIIAYFGSKLEQRYWVKFKLMEKSGAITDLKRIGMFGITKLNCDLEKP